MNTSHKITVIMPFYNNAKYLDESISSILNQTYRDFTFVIIDDGSIDNPDKVINKYLNDDRVVYVKNKDNKGLPHNLNKYIRESKSEYIARMDGDDISEPMRLEKEVEFLEKSPKYVMVGTQGVKIDEEGRVVGEMRKETKDWIIRAKMIDNNQFIHGSILARRESLIKAGLYNEKYERGQDYALWFEMIKQGKVANLKDYLYRWRDRNHTRVNSKELMMKQKYSHKYVVENIENSGRFNRELLMARCMNILILIKRTVFGNKRIWK